MNTPRAGCEHCGATVYSGPPGCPRCGAPQCCPQCCKIDALETKLAEVTAEKETAERRVRELERTSDKYRKAVIDLAHRGYGVSRPKWLLEIIDSAEGSAQ